MEGEIVDSNVGTWSAIEALCTRIHIYSSGQFASISTLFSSVSFTSSCVIRMYAISDDTMQASLGAYACRR
jgi:hypothetical protein